MPLRLFCTYFDHHYLSRGLALYESLRRHCPEFELWILCLSRECFDWLAAQRLPRVRLVSLPELELGDAELLSIKKDRSLIEYYFTCTPSLPRHVFQARPAAELVTYIDADLFFFSSPEPLFLELGEGSIAICEHRFPPALRHLEIKGVFNVGWVSFRNDERGRACLNWWRQRCLEWCYDRVEEGRYGDQKYLDLWPKLFPGLVVLRNHGANLAPWNLANYRLRFHDGSLWAGDDRLVFFHFHGFQQVNDWLYESKLIGFQCRPTPLLHRHLFLPYWRALRCAQTVISSTTRVPIGVRQVSRLPRAKPGDPLWRVISTTLRRWLRLAKGVQRQHYGVVWPFQE